MTAADAPGTGAAGRGWAPVCGRALLPVTAGALFLAAVLLFSAQPMVVSMVLPTMGGSPGTWATAQVFFQFLLLAGYLYAHAISRIADARVAVALHLTVLTLALAALPIALPGHGAPSPASSPIPALLALLGATVGLPFFATASTAPLLQHWFSRSRHPRAGDPYFLYSASNLGGLVALLGYPMALDNSTGLARQGELWATGYAVLLAAIAAAGVSFARRAPPVHAAAPPVLGAETAGPGAATRARWLLLAFAPSSLMLGVTLHITTDVAATPLLWVIPLALYLTTWVITFGRRPLLRHAWMLRAQPLLVAALVVFFDTSALLPALLLHVATFFVCAMVCHGELARSRPHPARLTEFYLWVSLGGVLGGAFSGILAPMLFESVLEYPIALVLACALRPPSGASCWRARLRDFALPVGLAALYLAASAVLQALRYTDVDVAAATVAVGVAVLLWLLRVSVVRFALAAALVLSVTRFDLSPDRHLIQARSFFGVHRVLDVSAQNDGLLRGRPDRYHLLVHGTTVHGAQRWSSGSYEQPLTYYARRGPAGQVLDELARIRPDSRIGVIGLGSGSLSCYRRPEQSLTYFEIDPLVVELASDPRYLRFLTRCAEDATVVQGDGRLGLEQWTGPDFDLLVVDAFTSDSVPVHLITREALALYASRLAPGGALLLHLSNRHLDLAGVAAATAQAAGLVTRVQRHEPGARSGPYRWPSVWMLAARSAAHVGRFALDRRWEIPPIDARPWTDDYANVVAALRWDWAR